MGCADFYGDVFAFCRLQFLILPEGKTKIVSDKMRVLVWILTELISNSLKSKLTY